MEIIKVNYEELIDIKYISNLCAAIGQFDGLHEAHLVLINKAVNTAKLKNKKSCVITFSPHPDFVLKKNSSFTLITPDDYKINMMTSLNVDYLIIIVFNAKVASIEHQDFIKKILIPLGVTEVFVGEDFKYGYQGLGNINTIVSDSDNSIILDVTPEIKYNESKIGSSLIREYLAKGNIETVNELLKRPYQVEGTVIKGSQIGTKLEIPTANLQMRDDFVPIRNGVYGVIVRIKDENIRSLYYGICNVGHNPSFNYKENLSLETHLFDFNENLYDRKINISFIFRIRDEKLFLNTEEFKIQIGKDKNYAKRKFEELYGQ